jgi:hypothetical protein
MNKIICCIPADNIGNKLWIKDLMEQDKKVFVKYRSTYNDFPFIETEIFMVDGGKNMVITGDDGTILFRFSVNWLNKLIDN